MVIDTTEYLPFSEFIKVYGFKGATEVSEIYGINSEELYRKEKGFLFALVYRDGKECLAKHSYLTVKRMPSTQYYEIKE